MAAGTAEKPKTTAPKTNGRADIDAAHKALGTSIEGGIDPGPQDPHDGDPDETGAGTPAIQLSFAMAGKKPTTAGLRLVGGKLDIDQQFAKGQKIELRIEAEIREVAFVDQVDGATGQIIGSERRHKAHIIGVAVL